MLFLGIDLGTSYFKSGVFDASGKMLGFERLAVPKWQEGSISELSHDGFLNTVRNCVTAAIRDSGRDIDEIVSLSYGSQANSFILLDHDRQEISPITIWNDGQACLTREVGEFAAGKAFRDITGMGMGISNYNLINRLKWLQYSNGGLWQRTAHVLTLPDYLSFKLIGEMAVDASTSSLTGLLDFRNAEWWEEAITIAGLNKSQLSNIYPLGTKTGMVKDKSNFLGLKEGTVFCCGGLDHHVAAIGAGVGKFFDVSESTGTVIAAVELSPDCKTQDNICLARGLSDSMCFRMTFDENGALALEWYQRNYAPTLTFDELFRMAESANEDCDGLVAYPSANKYEGLSGFRNVRPKHHHGHFIKAIMQSTAKSLDNIFNELEVKPDARIVSTGGGAKSLLWQKVKNRVTGREMSRPASAEAACLGAAMIAAAGVGAFENIFAAQSAWLNSEN